MGDREYIVTWLLYNLLEGRMTFCCGPSEGQFINTDLLKRQGQS